MGIERHGCITRKQHYGKPTASSQRMSLMELHKRRDRKDFDTYARHGIRVDTPTFFLSCFLVSSSSPYSSFSFSLFSSLPSFFSFLRIYDCRSGSRAPCLALLHAHASDVNALRWSPVHGDLLLSGMVNTVKAKEKAL